MIETHGEPTLSEATSAPLPSPLAPARREDDPCRLLRLYETILSTTDDFAYIFDTEARFLYANARLLKVWDKTLDQVIGKTCLDLGYPDWHAAMHAREIEEIVRTRQPIRGEVPFTGDSGIYGVYDYIFKPVLDADGNVEVIVGTTRDVTERKRGEEALSRLAAVVASSDDAIFSTTPDGLLTSWNAGAERTFGYAAAEAVGRPVALLVPPEHRGAMPDALERLRRGGASERYETVLLAKDGRAVLVSLTVSPLRDPEGKVTGTSAIARDITEERQRQEALRTELERLVEERTASLREAVAQMEEFSYSVSHDLRAPLRAMQGYAQALLEDHGAKLDAEGRDYLQRIVSSGARMDRLTRDVLVYSKVPRAAMPLQAVDLHGLAEDIAGQYRQAPRGADVALAAPLLPVLGNESFLSQAVSNLVDNAVKFCPADRTPRVRLRTEPSGERVRLWVEDNGIGVLPEHQQRIWGMFERVHPQHLYDGTGIGLAIVRKTIERMNGAMGVESTGDGISGSRFWIELPPAPPS